ncbi:DUF998 domain-containing protein [Peptostreptococcaceae bacterium OttesenSCG-928-C18]|nr:DUF998 domain-containing protein [Peptostreptococcaceae bacterium OttesenSCG-928-C18]
MKKTLINWLGLLGVVSLISYTVAVVFSPLACPGYNWMAQGVSDLMAINSPSLILWNQLSSLYGICGIVSIMSVCIFVQNKLSKTLKIGIYLFTVMNWVSNIGYTMFPLTDTGVNARTFQDKMHIIVTIMVVVLSVASLLFIMVGGYRYKKYKSLAVYATITFLLMLIGAIGVNVVPSEYFGIPERFSVFAATIFNAILGIYLFKGFNISVDKNN